MLIITYWPSVRDKLFLYFKTKINYLLDEGKYYWIPIKGKQKSCFSPLQETLLSVDMQNEILGLQGFYLFHTHENP